MDIRKQLLGVAALLTVDESALSKYTDHLEELFDAICVERLGKDFENAIEAGDYESAVHYAAEYFRSKPDFSVPSLSARGAYNKAEAENSLRGKFRVINIDWEFEDGKIDFLFDPTKITLPVNNEWLWQFNRHAHWASMARAYSATGDGRFATEFSRQLLLWIAQTDIPQKWNGAGSAWRTIECGLRLLGNWQVAYDGFRRSLPDGVLLLMIASMLRQSRHLVANPTAKNWLMMESNGVYTFSSLFPELSDSAENRKIAAERLVRELELQILPDGMHNELSPDYQYVVMICSYNFCTLAGSLGLEHEIPERFRELMRKTTQAAIMLSTPALTQPLTNDTHIIKTEYFTSLAEKALGKSPEYSYVNCRRTEGEPPAGDTASAYLPYAGLAVMRSDWSADAAYLCFDVGPLGMAHYHQDMLNINIYKGSEELIYDDGGGQYEISEMRKYAISGYAHNTLLVDGSAQKRKEPLSYNTPYDAGWISNAEFDYARGVYDSTFGENLECPASHKREVRFCKPDFFVVSDTLKSKDEKNHCYELLLHLDTTSVNTLPRYKNAIISDYGREYEIAIIPLDGDGAELEVASGTESPIRGWFNGRNETYLHPATTLSRKVCGVRDFKFHTLFFPIKRGGGLPEIKKCGNNILKIAFSGKKYTVDLDRLDK